MDGWVVGWLDGWVDGWMDGWFVGSLDQWMVGWLVLMADWMGMDACVCMYMCGCVHVCPVNIIYPMTFPLVPGALHVLQLFDSLATVGGAVALVGM